jgi:hypothetical protein
VTEKIIHSEGQCSKISALTLLYGKAEVRQAPRRTRCFVVLSAVQDERAILQLNQTQRTAADQMFQSQV